MTSLVTPHGCPIDERSSFSRWSMRLWKECLDLSAHQVKTATSNRRSIKDENLETASHVLRFFDLSPKVSSLNTVNQRSWKHRVALMTIRKNFLKQLLMFWKIQAYFKELMFEHRLFVFRDTRRDWDKFCPGLFLFCRQPVNTGEIGESFFWLKHLNFLNTKVRTG